MRVDDVKGEIEILRGVCRRRGCVGLAKIEMRGKEIVWKKNGVRFVRGRNKGEAW